MKRVVVAVLGVGFAVGVAWLMHPSTPQVLDYAGSESCRSCHEKNYLNWDHSLHSRAFLPVDRAVILGDFTSDDPVLTFDKSDVEFVVGNRWEQIYVQKIDDEFFPLPARWFVKQKKWDAYKVDSWHKTAMSSRCNGCHATGLDPESLEFSEFSVGCEACHGPAALHVSNHRMLENQECSPCHKEVENSSPDISKSVSSTVCGQCHSRGKSVPFPEMDDQVFNFPVGYIIGDSLPSTFESLAGNKDLKAKYWWGNGLAKARHQEFADWEKSGHSKALLRVKGHQDEHLEPYTDECLECHSTDYMHAGTATRPSRATAQYGITCVGCHNPHALREDAVTGDATIKQCTDCHREAASCPKPNNRCKFPCSEANVSCEDCHMPYVVKSGGWYSIRGHGFRIVIPESESGDEPNSCRNADCHPDWSNETINRVYREHFADWKTK